MGTEGSNDSLNNMNWKTVSGDASSSSNQPVVKKRLHKKMREIPDYYFLPRRSIPSAIALYGALAAAGVGTAMLVEIWVNKKIKEDGGIIWEMDKS